jgi:hypothetical protein
MLARGWERQLDRKDNPLFYPQQERPLDPAAYLRWLRENAVRYVALPDAPLDSSAIAEGRLLARGSSQLHPVWRSAHWRVFAVRGAAPLLEGPGTLVGVNADAVTVHARRPGRFLLRMHYSSYWQLPAHAGCVMPGRDGWTALQLSHPGTVRLTSDFALDRVVERDRNCT